MKKTLGHTPQLKAPSRKPLLRGFLFASGAVIAMITAGVQTEVGRKMLIGQNDSATSLKPPKNEKKEHKMEITIDGNTFISDSLDEATFLRAYQQAKDRVGGPYLISGETWTIEIPNAENVTLGIALFNEKKIISDHQKLSNELAHFLIGIDPASNRWPMVLGEFLAHSASFPRGQVPKRFRDTDLSDPFIQMHDHTAASSGVRNFFYDMRNDAYIMLNEKISDETRKAIIQAALKLDKIKFEELGDFLRTFGVDHPIIQQGAAGVYKRLVYGRHYEGEEFILPVSYERKREGGEDAVNTRFTLTPIIADGRPAPELILDVGIAVNNADPIPLASLIEVINSKGAGIRRSELQGFIVKETGQKIELSLD